MIRKIIFIILYFFIACNPSEKEEVASTDTLSTASDEPQSIDSLNSEDFSLSGDPIITILFSDNNLKVYEISDEYYLDETDTTIYIKLILAVVDPNNFEAKISGLIKEGQGTSLVNTRESVEIAIGSGFVKSYYPLIPSGLLKIDDKLFNELSTSENAYSGVIYEIDGQLSFANKSDFSVQNYNSGFQVGPIIILDGIIDILEDEPKRIKPSTRAFIGENENGLIFLGLTQRPINLYHLGNYLLHVWAKLLPENSNIKYCYNLSGGGAQGLYIDIGEKKLMYGNTQLEQASIIAFSRK